MVLFPAPPHRDALSRRNWLARSGAASLALTLGCADADRPPDRFRVSGPSMAPTLWGPHHRVACDRCGVAFRIHAGSLAPHGDTFPCWHCGAPVASPAGDPEPGDVVAVAPWRAGSAPRRVPDGVLGADGHVLRRGAVVAIANGGRPQLKRLVALPGETVRVEGNRLRVDGRPLMFSAGVQPPWVPVDFDAHREHSRWAPSAPGTDSWRRREDRRWHGAASGHDDWLVYRHASVYHGGRAGPIRDDYPGNAGLSRQLATVESLMLTVDVQFEPEGEIEVFFFYRGRVRRSRQSGSGSLRLDPLEVGGAVAQDAGARVGSAHDWGAPVGEAQPVALRLIRGRARISRLALWRRVEYRLRRLDDRSDYPLRLAGDECFVLGDNVPVSVDSRDFGPLPIGEIAGSAVRGPRSAVRGPEARGRQEGEPRRARRARRKNE